MNKILILSNTAFSIEKFREHYLSKIYNYDFLIYTPNLKPKLKKKYKHIKTRKFRSKNLFDDFYQLYKILKKNKTTEIIVYSYKYQLIISLLKKIFKIKLNIISIIAGLGSFHLGNVFKKNFLYLVSKFIVNSSKYIICINPKDLDYFKKLSQEKKFFQLPTEGVDTNLKLEKKINKKRNFIFFARLIKEKGIVEYINAAKILKKKYPKLNFYVAGPSSQSIIGQSKFSLKTLNLINSNKKSLIFLDYVKDFKSIFPKMDCLVSPSYSEGAGTSVMEAMLSGLFIIGYKNSGHSYVLKNTGNFICDENTTENIIKQIEKFLKLEKIELNRIKQKSLKKIKKYFTADKVSNQFRYFLDDKYKIVEKSIDVVWPYYKDKTFLNTSISNLNKQTLKPKRLIFIDDGNKDNKLKKIIKSKLDKKIKFIYLKNKSNYGVTKSIEEGCKKIKSEYMYIQSTDDIIYSDFFEKNIRQLVKYPNSPYVFSNIKINNLTNNKKYFIEFDFIKDFYTTPDKIGNIYNNYQFKVYHNTAVINSKKFLKSNIFKDEFGRRADMLNLQFMSMNHGFCFLPDILSEFTIRKGQVSSNILDDKYLIKELKFIKKEKKKFYNFIINHNLHYEISLKELLKYKKIFNGVITFKYLIRSIKFKLWKNFRFYLNPKILNFLFKILN